MAGMTGRRTKCCQTCAFTGRKTNSLHRQPPTDSNCATVPNTPLPVPPTCSLLSIMESGLILYPFATSIPHTAMQCPNPFESYLCSTAAAQKCDSESTWSSTEYPPGIIVAHGNYTGLHSEPYAPHDGCAITDPPSSNSHSHNPTGRDNK
ncbi:hypothetical protein F5148DRAFT_527216 [Russula earlei]|uniref:Uncharacterized protein n=1 Tax=Russula earlei TaxID=71964 RepID=A0ACC0TX07_9AGAM|nr:hypothetical protein F5148DRAFT_527216 [Russula earlei]